MDVNHLQLCHEAGARCGRETGLQGPSGAPHLGNGHDLVLSDGKLWRLQDVLEVARLLPHLQHRAAPERVWLWAGQTVEGKGVGLGLGWGLSSPVCFLTCGTAQHWEGLGCDCRNRGVTVGVYLLNM
eukprot:355285-Chlamydomonas_euryale.AAC.3